MIIIYEKLDKWRWWYLRLNFDTGEYWIYITETDLDTMQYYFKPIGYTFIHR